ESHESPTPLEPHKRYRIRLQLRDRAHSFKVGNRVRVAVSSTQWPLIYPAPEAATLTLYCGRCELELPVRPPRPEDAQLRDLGTAYVPQTSGATLIEASTSSPRSFAWDISTQTLTETRITQPRRTRLEATGTEMFLS